MRDVHCHILPAVDDGSDSMQTSMAMLKAAKHVGITQITCTPHCRGSHFSQHACIEAYKAFAPYAQEAGVQAVLAYEVYYTKLMEIGVERAELLRNPVTNELLLELPVGGKPVDLDRTLFALQGQGLHVIIAHPERYACVQEDPDVAVDWHDRGCKLQLSSNFIAGGITSKSKKAAKQLLKLGVADYIASDAHVPHHYKDLHQALAKYGNSLSTVTH